MTEKQKKIAIIVSVIALALLLLLSSKKASGTTIVNQEQAPAIDVTIPSMNIPERSPFAIVLPGLPDFTPYQYSAISPCMCNGAAVSQPQNNSPLITYVTNMGNQGPNIYNYSAPKTNSGDFVGVYTG